MYYHECSGNQRTRQTDKKYLETAEKYIDDFNCDSVIKAYPIFNVFRKKEYRNKTFDKIPTLAELEQFLDFKHPVIDHVLVKTTDNKVWALIGKYKDIDYYAYIKGNKKDASFFEYLETLKPDKIYSLRQGLSRFREGWQTKPNQQEASDKRPACYV